MNNFELKKIFQKIKILYIFIFLRHGPWLSTISEVLHVNYQTETRVHANMADGRDAYNSFMAKVKAKRIGQTDNAGHGKGKKPKKGIECIVVQRVNSQPTGKLKKFELLDSRDFVDFTHYDSLTLKNIKHACESFYGAPIVSCDVLYSDRGPSCTLDEYVTGRKFYPVRFMTSGNGVRKLDRPTNQRQNYEFSPEFNNNVSHSSIMPFSLPSRSAFSKPKNDSGISSATSSAEPMKVTVPKSVTIADLLGAGKLIQPEVCDDVTLQLESFSIIEKVWLKNDQINFQIERKHFAAGGFRNAFKAVSNKGVFKGTWVVKKFQAETWEMGIFCKTYLFSKFVIARLHQILVLQLLTVKFLTCSNLIISLAAPLKAQVAVAFVLSYFNSLTYCFLSR